MKKRSYLFIGDLIEMEGEISINIFEDFYLQKASSDQQQTIKNFIGNYLNMSFISINKYENSQQKSVQGGGYTYVRLNENEWKYYVIEHSEAHATPRLELILSLSSLDLTVLFEATHYDAEIRGMAHAGLRTINYFHDDQFKRFPLITKKITNHSCEELSKINLLLSQFDKTKFSIIDKALNDYVRIKDISESSPFKILSCFSVLEFLLTTYRPRTSNGSSLSNQLQKKINLLNNQFDAPIDIQDYFKGSHTHTLEMAIEKLYQYRNDIAHGNLSDFEKDLSIFKSQREKILPFLLDILRRILIIALERPQLITDLKDC